MKIDLLNKIKELEAKTPRSDYTTRVRLAKTKLEILSSDFSVQESKQIKPNRPTTEYEQKVNVLRLAEAHETLDDYLYNGLLEILEQRLDQYSEQVNEDTLLRDSIITTAVILLLRKHLKEVSSRAYEIGKSTASSEIGVKLPARPKESTTLINARAEYLSRRTASQINDSTQGLIIDSLNAGASPDDIIIAVKDQAKQEVSTSISGIQGILVASVLGLARRDVFKKHKTKIIGYQRSEILDSITCFLCESWDKRIVRADSEWVNLDIFHNNCRGWFTPILGSETPPEFDKLPKSITDGFEKVGGIPIMNTHTQLKRPIKKKTK